jgi:cyclophilin family peptidyl-prolyl cis-trans isomerase
MKMKLHWGMLCACVLLSGCTFETPSVKQKNTEKDATESVQFGNRPKESIDDTSQDKQPLTQQRTSSQAQTHQSTGTTMNTNKKSYATAPVMQIDPAKRYQATLKTALGDIEIMLHAKETPITVNNFVFLAREKFYDNVIFHRTIKGFMIQGGDPTGTGMGGPGYKFNDEPFTGEYRRGVVAMANSGLNTNGSQFFIMHADAGLPKNYVIFGEVTKGMDVVDKIAEAPTQPGGEGSKPMNPIEIRTVNVTETP